MCKKYTRNNPENKFRQRKLFKRSELTAQLVRDVLNSGASAVVRGKLEIATQANEYRLFDNTRQFTIERSVLIGEFDLYENIIDSVRYVLKFDLACDTFASSWPEG